MVLRNSKKSLKSTQNSTIHWLHCKTARYSYKIVAVKKKKKKHPYFLPKYSAVNWARLPLFSNEVNGKTRTLSLRCLLVLKYALEEESNSSVPGDTVKKINNKNRENKKKIMNLGVCVTGNRSPAKKNFWMVSFFSSNHKTSSDRSDTHSRRFFGFSNLATALIERKFIVNRQQGGNNKQGWVQNN